MCPLPRAEASRLQTAGAHEEGISPDGEQELLRLLLTGSAGSPTSAQTAIILGTEHMDLQPSGPPPCPGGVGRDGKSHVVKKENRPFTKEEKMWFQAN